MGLIKRLRKKIPSVGQPKSNVSRDEFEKLEENSGGSGEDGEEQDGEEQEDEEQDGNGSGEEQDDEGQEDEEQDGNGSGEEQDGEEQDGESSDSNSDSDSDMDDDLIDDMEQDSAERDMSDWNNTRENYEKPSQFIENFYEQVQEDRAEPETEIDRRREDRDDRVENKRTAVTAQRLLDEYNDRFADDIEEAFRKIKTREAPEPAEYGQRINMRGVIRRRSGDKTEERLYLDMDQSEVGDRCITVVVDSSGSMDELEIKLALMALADATEQIGDRFTATTYYTTGTYSANQTHTDLITAPTENFDIEHTESFNADGYTPTADGILDGRSLADITPNSEDVIIVITDGIANIDTNGEKSRNTDRNSKAMTDARDQVNAAINEGKRVIGMGVGQDLTDEDMAKIFGSNYIRADMDEIADELVEIYRRQMDSISA